MLMNFTGPRRIFTKRPVDERYLVHSVQFGRHGRKGWLQVDSFPNITGKAPGSRENLNITSKVSLKWNLFKNYLISTLSLMFKKYWAVLILLPILVDIPWRTRKPQFYNAATRSTCSPRL